MSSSDKNIDIVLFENTKDGCKKSFQKLFEIYYSDLVRFANIYLHDNDHSEEVVQEFFTQFWVNKTQIEIKTSLKSYLYKSIRNRSFNFLRDKRNDLSVDEDLSVINKIVIHEDIHEFDFELMKSCITTAIDELPEKCGQIFRLSREENLSYKEISDKINVSHKTVENQMGIALKKLRSKLKPLLEAIVTIMIIFFEKS